MKVDRRNNPKEVSVRTKRTPERTCIGCRQKHQIQNLLRLACTPDDNIIVDRVGRLPGRGAHVCFRPSCLQKALKPATLTVAFKRSVEAPPYLLVYEIAVQILQDRLGTYLGMAQKAGLVVSGYAPLHKALAQDNIACLVLATDIARTRREEYQSWCIQHRTPFLMYCTKIRLGMIIGQSSRSAVGLTEASFCKLLSTTKASLDALQSCGPSSQAKS